MSVALNQLVPPFQAICTSGLTFSLQENRGRPIVLYFYPKDNTPGCTTQAANFRDTYAEFEALNTVIIGISRDSLKSHENFKAKLDLPFELLADTDEQVCTLFEVIKNKKMYGKEVRGIERSTFVIDAKGILKKEWRGLKVPGHVDTVLQAIRELTQ